jgi:hypothetical protein
MTPIATREATPQRELVLRIDNKEPIRASDLGGLLSGISSDYGRFARGRELVIVRLVQGSLLAVLQEASAMADQVNHLFDFANHIREMLGGLFGGSAVLLLSRRSSGAKTAENLLKTAVGCKAHVHLRYKGPKGERLSVVIQPVKARKALAVLETAKKGSARPRIASTPQTFAQIARSADPEALEAIIQALVESRDRHLLQTLLEISERHRLYTAAEKTRANGGGQRIVEFDRAELKDIKHEISIADVRFEADSILPT